jgi:1-acyl-sn-glycerol-3-phosphate acyltransferase
MLQPEVLSELSIQKRPWGQILWAQLININYNLPPKTEIVIEGWENLPTDRQVCLAMNHTDRYNYFPFQLKLYHERNQFTASWVKAKYYENWASRTFLLNTSNIPLASRGYIITSSFSQQLSRSPSKEEYRIIRDLMDAKRDMTNVEFQDLSSPLREFLAPAPHVKIAELERNFEKLCTEVVRLSLETFKKGLHILVFPEGTRSKTLLKGHTGLAQMSQCMGADIVPIGCNGSDLVYRGDIPWAKGGRIVYRIGKPICIDGPEIGDYRIEENFVPFSRESQFKYGQRFQSITDVVMNHINDLLDSKYQRNGDGSINNQDTNRFL